MVLVLCKRANATPVLKVLVEDGEEDQMMMRERRTEAGRSRLAPRY